MGSELVITVKDLLLFILWAGIVAFFVYLILILRNVLKIVKNINKVVEDNKVAIDSTLEVVPEITKHAEIITGEVAHDIQSFRATIDNIASTTESVSGTIKSNQGFVDGLSSFMHTLSIGKVLYDKYFSSKVKHVKDAADEVEQVIKNQETSKEASKESTEEPFQS